MIGLYAGHVKLEDLMRPINTRESFDTSAIGKLGYQYEGIATDIYFYDGLRQSVSGDPATRRTRFLESMERASQVGRFDFYETHMARYLLNSPQ